MSHPAEPTDRDESRLELIVSSTLYLMSAYGRNGGCPQMAAMVVRHLDLIAEREDAPPVLRSSCAHLIDQWECLRQQAAARPSARASGTGTAGAGTPGTGVQGAGVAGRLRALLH